MRTSRWTIFAALLAVLLAGGAVGCADDYVPRVICHNSNCLEPADPDEDDTLEALEASLALEDSDGRPLIDGIEIDTFWYGEAGRCLFAHDLAHPERSVDAPEAVTLINDALAARRAQGMPLTRQAPEFSVLIELKGHVTERKADKHTAEQRRQHVACALALGHLLADGAEAGDYPLEVVYTSFDPNLLKDLKEDGEFAALNSRVARARLGILQGIPKPLDTQTEPLDAFSTDLEADFVSVHPQWTRPADLHAYASRNLELGYWMFSIVPETLNAIGDHRPTYITTGEARALAAWLDTY